MKWRGIGAPPFSARHGARHSADTEAQLAHSHQSRRQSPDADGPTQERFPAELINLNSIISDAGGLNEREP
jgi:hypothetical protein